MAPLIQPFQQSQWSEQDDEADRVPNDMVCDDCNDSRWSLPANELNDEGEQNKGKSRMKQNEG
eukprot:175493-Pelagomonas_calceolata.AAC.3